MHGHQPGRRAVWQAAYSRRECVLVSGGAAPQVKAAAAASLRAMVDPALGVLGYAMKRKSRMPIRYRKWSIKAHQMGMAQVQQPQEGRSA